MNADAPTPPGPPVTARGTGLFTGQAATVSVRPGDPGTPGIRVRHRGAEAPATIDSLDPRPVHPAFAYLRPRCTAIRVGEASVATVEHALSALAGLGRWNAMIETDDPELPIFDGSATPFVDLIVANPPRPTRTEPITLPAPVEVRDGDAWIRAEPADAIDYAYTLDYGPASPIPTATARWAGDPDDYQRQIAPARTFCTLAEADQMRALGLFTAFTPADLLVIGPDGPIDNAWRFPDEGARHKLLDLIGDLALLGRPLHARVHAHKAGHALTHALVRAVRGSTPV